MRGKIIIFLVMAVFLYSCNSKQVISTPPMPKPAKIALVLGAGASRGFAHIGVLKVLEANKIPIHMIVGTSAGSFAGSLFAYGYSAYDIQKLSLTMQRSDIADIGIPENGLFKGDRLETFVNKAVNYTPLEKMKIPLYIVATDIQSGQEMVFGRGNTGVAVRASCSVPGIFRPVKIGDKTYVDGGVVSPVAVDVAHRYGADVVIAVDISADMDKSEPQGIMDTILQSVNIMYAKLATIQLGKADIVIRPKVGYIGSGDFDKRHEAIMEGEKAAIEALPTINAILNRLRQEGRLPSPAI